MSEQLAKDHLTEAQEENDQARDVGTQLSALTHGVIAVGFGLLAVKKAIDDYKESRNGEPS